MSLYNKKAKDMQPIRISIFASGNGTNAQQITEYLAGNDRIVVDSIIYNRRDAYVAQRAANLGIEAKYFNRGDFMESNRVLQFLQQRCVDYIILAGFLLLVPQNLLDAYPDRILNIHPALLPSYGGKGMYGHHVHEAVIANRETESGITVHVVDSHYDHGRTVFQARCCITPQDTSDTLAEKIHILEKSWFPRVVEAFVLGKEMPKQESILCV